MKIKYDREEDILMIELDPDAAIDHAEHTHNVILHLSSDDRPVLLEILNASEFISSLVKSSIRAEPVTV
ncbi:MAG: DUF2283 domain-containing protein [Chloroflexota bacterium]